MRKYHQEIDQLRKTGAYKEALDLARYAFAQRPGSSVLKGSYSWAIYSYIKQKKSMVISHLKEGDLHPAQLIDASHPRVIELNQLCREYRLQKLLVNDLCFSLILRQLCQLKPAPLGLYGLLAWSRSAGLREEDYLPESHYTGRGESRPLILDLAHSMAYLSAALDDTLTQTEAIRSLDKTALVELTANLHLHAYKKVDTAPIELLLEGCWLSRRAGLFHQGIETAISLMHIGNFSPRLWWEIALCLAEVKQVEAQSLQFSHNGHSLLHLSNAFYCGLYAVKKAISQGSEHTHFIINYAQLASWAKALKLLTEARYLLSYAIELSKQVGQPFPFKWEAVLNELGGAFDTPLVSLNMLFEKSNSQARGWLETYQKTRD